MTTGNAVIALHGRPGAPPSGHVDTTGTTAERMSDKSPYGNLTDAERARRRRRRENENLQNFNIDAPCAIIDRLIDGGYLVVEDAGDRRAEEHALEELLADWFG